MQFLTSGIIFIRTYPDEDSRMTTLTLIFFVDVFLIVKTRDNQKKIFLLILALGLNPLANQLGIFGNPKWSIVGNIGMHIIFPVLIRPKILLSFTKIPGLIFLSILLLSMLSLLYSSEAILPSHFAGFKTLLLMLGSWLWANSIVELVREEYQCLINERLVSTLFWASVTLFAVCTLFSRYYFIDGRYQAAGGFNSPAILSGIIIIITFLNADIAIFKKALICFVELVILLSTGSRSVLIATVFVCVMSQVVLRVEAKKFWIKGAQAIFPSLALIISAVVVVNSERVLNYRAFDFFTSLRGTQQGNLGTLGFRENMLTNMLGEYSSFSLKAKAFGLGPGGGTTLAMHWIDSLRDINYSSARVFHNGLLQLLIENGIVGVGLFFLLVLRILYIRGSEKFYLIALWIPFYSIGLFFSANPFATSGLLSTFAYIPFFIDARSGISHVFK